MCTNVNEVEDIVMACMPSTCDVKAYDFEPLATDTVPSQNVHESSSEASDSDGSDEDEMTAVAVQEVSDWWTHIHGMLNIH